MPIQSYGDVLISPRMDSRIKDRSMLYKGRNQSPKFRDILRERCHSRIKASRRALLDEFRHKSNPDDIRSVLSSILHEEIRTLKEGAPGGDSWDETLEIESSSSDREGIIIFKLPDLSDDIEIIAQLESKCLSENDQWIIREYEKVLEEEEATLFREWENEVICPLCEKASLIETIDDSVFCPKCQQRFPDRTSLTVLKEVLDTNILNHNLTCDEKSQFALISENDSLGLYELCDSCGLFVHLL